jgi:ABC-type multidrug transport system fused ATPase/permease subunit
MQAEESVSVIGDAMASILTVKALQAECDVIGLFLRKSESELPRKILIWNSFLLALFSSIPFAVFPLIVSVGFWYSGYIYVGSGLSLASVIQASYAVGDAGEVATYIISQLPEFMQYKWEAMKVFDLLDNDMSVDRGDRARLQTADEDSSHDGNHEESVKVEESASRSYSFVYQGGDTQVAPSTLRRITLSHVCFSYKSALDNPAITDISLSARMGELVTIFGPYRSGKSTIMDLILRYYDPQYGRIFLNESVGIKDLRISFLRSIMSIVPQTPVMFDNLSLIDNVLYGLGEDAIQRRKNLIYEIFEILEISPIDDTINNNWIMDRELCQRVSIARALVRNTPLIMFDEPFVLLSRFSAASSTTNNEDITSRLQDYLVRKKSDKITLVATSIPSPFVAQSDRIYVMDWGRIVQEGTHTELMSDESGIYWKMSSVATGRATLNV